ncbi:MAG TPA: plasmid stabilization protein [Rubrivivax sp.]|nr:plasmid stabilization protein [Rubrivivax sp.]
MASITIRNLDDELKARLRVRAAQQGRSMEEEARVLLRQALDGPRAAATPHLADLALSLFGARHGVELPAMPRAKARPVPSFDE